jgi:nucleoside-diphosphate-sugar epimerase
MPRILIAGCGYVGTAAADLFHAAGWEVQGWTQSDESAARLTEKPYPVIAVDVANPREIGRHSENFDVVIHCASTRGGDVDLYRQTYLAGARNLSQRFLGSTILFTSSTSVYAQHDGSWVNEESETKPASETGQILLETEKIVRRAGGLVARLAGIYGPRRAAMLRKFLEGEAVIDPENDRYVNQVHRDDIAAALFLLVNRPAAAGEVYNVVDDQPMLQSDVYRWLSGKLSRPLPPIAKSTSASKRGRSNKRVSNTKLRQLGWVPDYPTFADAMEKSILASLSVF